MSAAPQGEVTALLLRWSEGDAAAHKLLISLVYRDLRALAARALKRERRDHTLQPTALVHEAYGKLVDQRLMRWQNRAQSTHWPRR